MARKGEAGGKHRNGDWKSRGLGDGQEYAMIGTDALARMSQLDVPPLTMKVWLLAASNLRADGHSPFAPGALAGTLGRGATEAGRKSVSRAVRQGVELGLFAEGSCVQCVVMAFPWIKQKQGKVQCLVNHRQTNRLPATKAEGNAGGYEDA